MKKSRNRRAIDMGKLKPSGVLNWKKSDNRELHILQAKQFYAKEPNSQFVGEWKEKSRKLRLCVSVDAGLCHMNISHPTRYPTWDEILRTCYKFFPETMEMVMHFPKQSEYVNLHENCFHLFQLRTEIEADPNYESMLDLVFEDG